MPHSHNGVCTCLWTLSACTVSSKPRTQCNEDNIYFQQLSMPFQLDEFDFKTMTKKLKPNFGPNWQVNLHFCSVDVEARDPLGAHQNEYLQKNPNQLYFQTHAILKIRAGNTIDWGFFGENRLWQVSGGSPAAPPFTDHVCWENIAGYNYVYREKKSICNSPQIHMFLPVVNGVFNDIVINCPLVLNSSEWKGFRFCGSYQLTTRIPEKEIEKWDILYCVMGTYSLKLSPQWWYKILFELAILFLCKCF